MEKLETYKGFAIVLIPAAIGGAIWNALGLPLGWLMGAAIVTGFLSFQGIKVVLPKLLYYPSLAMIGASVGLTINPSVVQEMVLWLPLMAVMGFVGVGCAAMLTPFVSKKGQMSPATAFFSLMPGGVIEMANIGEPHGADRTTIAALHAIRVALVVGILPLGLYSLFPATGGNLDPRAFFDGYGHALLVPIALAGGWIGKRIKMPAPWLLGAIILVGIFTASGVLDGKINSVVLALAQIIVGISLGAKFLREKLASIPKAIMYGGPALLAIIMFMAGLAVIFSFILPYDIPTLTLAFSIGGMAEMVLTARALELNMALVAAYQSVRAVLVNWSAGLVWSKIAPLYEQTNSEGN